MYFYYMYPSLAHAIIDMEVNYSLNLEDIP